MEMKKILMYVSLPFYVVYQLLINNVFLFETEFLKIAWQCSKSKLQIKFGLCKTYTIQELKEILK